MSVRVHRPRVLGVTGLYPSQARPETGTFVKAIFAAMRKCGAQVEVLAPISRTRMLADMLLRPGLPPRHFEIEEGFRPGYWSISPRLLPWRNLGDRLSLYQYGRAVARGFPSFGGRFDFVYAHFFGSGLACVPVCENERLACIVGIGESGLDGAYDRILGKGVFARTLGRFAGVVAVSEDNEAICRRACPELEDRLVLLPNGVDFDVFFPRTQCEARRALGLPVDARIIVFNGHFVEGKGPLRVIAALRELKGIKGVFLGRGQQSPAGSEVLFAGPVEHDQVPLWLSAADCFVLPSLAEGMSNAILEAMACGLPLIVSDRPFNRSFLNDECALFIDPMDPRSIAKAVVSLLRDALLRRDLTQAGLQKVAEFSLQTRAQKILEFGHRCAIRCRKEGLAEESSLSTNYPYRTSS